MGLSPDWSIGSLRLTLGHSNEEADVARVLEALPGIVERLRVGG
jgi:cysteine sulfinate desulfinase/cysteine desulfurase-like protein